jgi:hypothetical protein
MSDPSVLEHEFIPIGKRILRFLGFQRCWTEQYDPEYLNVRGFPIHAGTVLADLATSQLKSSQIR